MSEDSHSRVVVLTSSKAGADVCRERLGVLGVECFCTHDPTGAADVMSVGNTKLLIIEWFYSGSFDIETFALNAKLRIPGITIDLLSPLHPPFPNWPDRVMVYGPRIEGFFEGVAIRIKEVLGR